MAQDSAQLGAGVSQSGTVPLAFSWCHVLRDGRRAFRSQDFSVTLRDLTDVLPLAEKILTFWTFDRFQALQGLWEPRREAGVLPTLSAPRPWVGTQPVRRAPPSVCGGCRGRECSHRDRTVSSPLSQTRSPAVTWQLLFPVMVPEASLKLHLQRRLQLAAVCPVCPGSASFRSRH